MSKRRVIVTFVILALVLLVGGLIGMWVYINTGPKLLSRANIALQAGNHTKAVRLALKFAQKYPDDWEGYYVAGAAYSRQKNYPKAIELLTAAVKKDPRQVHVVLELARAHAEPGLINLDLQVKSKVREIETLSKSINQLTDANKALLLGAPEKEIGRIDLLETRGRNLDRIGIAHRMVAQAHEAKAKAENIGAGERKGHQEQGVLAQKEADAAQSRAIEILLEVLRKGGKRDRAAEVLYRLCKERNATKAMEEVRAIILSMKDPPPAARMAIMIEDLSAGQEEDSRAQWRRDLNRSAKTLDELIKANPGNTLAKRLRASVAMALMDHATAERLCKEILAVNQDHAYARLILARVRLARGDVTEAERDLYRLVARYKYWPEVNLAYAEAAWGVGKKQLAIRHAQMASRLDPKNARISRFLATRLSEAGHLEEARTEAKKGWDANRGDPAALIQYVRQAKSGGKLDKLREELDKTKIDYATDPAVLSAVAIAYQMLDDQKEAVALIKIIAGLEPGNSKGRMAVATALAQLGRSSEAETMLNKELKENPENPGAYYALGNLYTRTQRATQALEMFRRAVDLDPSRQSAPYRLALARALFNAGELDEARSAIDGVDPSLAAVAVLHMQLDVAQGKAMDTQALLANVKDAGKGAGESGLSLALLSLRTGQVPRCVEICTTQLSKKRDAADPATPALERGYRTILAQAYLQQNKRDEAVTQLTALLKSDPTRLASYRVLAGVLATKVAVGELGKEMAKIKGADPNLIDLTLGAMLIQQNKGDLARVVLQQLTGRFDAPEDTRYRAHLLLAESLARANRLADALEQLDPLHGKKLWHRLALESRAKLQIRAEKYDDAEKTLRDLRKVAVDEKDGALMHRTARLYLAMKKPDEAMAVARQLEGLMPNDARTYLLQADIHLVKGGKGADREAIRAAQKAIEKQPNNFRVYLVLAQLLERAGKRTEALDVLDQLAKCGRAGLSEALLARGRIFVSWGLHTQAAKAYQDIVEKVGYLKSPPLRFELGRALGALGRKRDARIELNAIPSYSQYYIPAQVLLASLADDTDRSLVILDAVEKTHPGSPAVLARRLAVLIEAKRYPQASGIIQAAMKAKKPVSPEAALTGLTAMLLAGDRHQAADVCLSLFQATRGQRPMWLYRAALLRMEDAAAGDVDKLLEPINLDKADLLGAMLGLCRAADKGDLDTAKKWHGRLNAIEAESAKLKPPRILPPKWPLLASLAADAVGQAGQYAKKTASRGLAENLVAAELVAHADQGAGARAEAVRLLKAELASELGMRMVARPWAQKVLKARPTCQWAAVVMVQNPAGVETHREALKLLKPPDGPLGKCIQAAVASADTKFEQAVKLYEELAKIFPSDATVHLQYALAAERAGDVDKALNIYTRILAATGGTNPVAANNAAYLISLKYPHDQARLKQAAEWADAAKKANPNMPALWDTFGWIAHLRKSNLLAREEIRRAVKAVPDSIENHYHLGVVENATGQMDLAEWHFEAAVVLGERAKAEKTSLPSSAHKAAELAAEELEKIKKLKEARKPKKKPDPEKEKSST